MKKLKQLSTLLFSMLIFSAFNIAPDLKQKEVENTLFWFNIMHSGGELSDMTWKVVLIDIVKVDPVKQSSEKEATCTAILEAEVATGDPTKQCDYTKTTLTIEFHFEKNKENKWILEGINKCASNVKVNEDHLVKFIEKNRKLNITVE